MYSIVCLDCFLHSPAFHDTLALGSLAASKVCWSLRSVCTYAAGCWLCGMLQIGAVGLRRILFWVPLGERYQDQEAHAPYLVAICSWGEHIIAESYLGLHYAVHMEL